MSKSPFKTNAFVGVRKAKALLSYYLHKQSPICITDHGEPRSALIPYDEFIELQEEIAVLRDTIEELKDEKLLKTISEGRKSYQAGKWVPARRLLSRLPL